MEPVLDLYDYTSSTPRRAGRPAVTPDGVLVTCCFRVRNRYMALR